MLLQNNMASLRVLYQSLVTLACLIALVSLGFGHRVHQDHAALDAQTKAFLHAGGQLSDLCEGTGDGHAQLSECPVCALTAGMDVPNANSGAPVRAAGFEYAAWTAHQSHADLAPFDFSRSSRAPPFA